MLRKLFNLYFSPDRELADKLHQILGFIPKDLELYKLAFYHKSTSNNNQQNGNGSHSNSNASGGSNNERLEFLGDAVLGTIVAEYLFQKYPNSDEGFLTKMRSKIVKRNSLNAIGESMQLDVILQEYNSARLSRSMLGNAVEALVGAVYLEQGYEGTKKYVVRTLLKRYLDIQELETYDDNYKSQLLEWSQKNGKAVSYKVIAKYKFEKRDRFKVAVLIDGEKIATADDFNKKSAEQMASEKALQNMGVALIEEE